MWNTMDVWVTGLGAMTPLGVDANDTWVAMQGGENGIGVLKESWAEELPVRIAAQLTGDPADSMKRTEARKLDRSEQIALVTAREAWADAGAPEVDPERVAVVLGTGIGGVTSLLGQNHILETSGPRRVSPHTVPMLMANGPAAWVSMDLNAQGGAHAPVSACASGAEAIALGLDLIRAGRVDVVVAGGVEASVHALPLTAFAQMMALSTSNDAPETASRPFDKRRNGFVLGEGGAVVVLERADHARARGSRAHGRLLGTGISSSASHITASDLPGQVRAMSQSLRDAGLSGTDVGVVHAHATSTPQGDVAEAQAIAQAVGTHPVVTATKSMTGHLLGASGALGAMAAILALRDGSVPPTRNLTEQDPEVALDVAAGSARSGQWQCALSNSFGFGGHNVSLVFGRA
ncbi:beta-ketoacyl-[acyl-carrier-protein] synthase family protein [Streptomyces sp. CHA1]|uniref:beta-ketoacyl-[acyl-carrier-protein] synthase family protein n=1 Tax=Streptomyces TaxID=1883 RepID=UPI00030CFAF5|nr:MULTISPECIES: beta-ketoacyl-[acyl-carrier-protein] synthase family protein [unclassified Streptomyces]MBP3081438.1 3-oxoacyl-ACP synthase [Streptomyces sp. 604F]MBT3158200.1 beta-ketoacyl-[acyl-carrier-protein] synthase family protein [Streptomyces sp. G11C]MCO6704582.1 beta-ketoacyl-[acyl-carrier-protein] synthase family protein [Streptomyces sp. CHB9.2]MCO6710849.1 beta-ketoacyl-[acyl-carrier-protein] synthase family protein [Streptomyces sp. CHA3]MCO6716653.1 beta-ketoacyl-[acyl-carrier-